MDLSATNKAPPKRNATNQTTKTDRVPRRPNAASTTGFRRLNTRLSTLPEIPDDLVLEILIRLPAKSLLRFKCVCKAWRATVSGQPFIAAHLQHSASNHRRRPSFLVAPCMSDLWQNSFSNNISFYQWHHDSLGGRQATRAADLMYSRDMRGRFWSAYNLAHCDGLVLLPTDSKLYILNPATRDLVMLSESIRRVHNPSSFCRGTVGFGRDPSTSRYKVVQCFRRSCDNNAVGDYSTGMEVFTIGSNTHPKWRDVVPPCPVQNWKNTTFFKGSLFWFIRERRRRDMN